MIILTNSASQTLAPGQSLTFDTVVLKTGCAELHSQGTAPVVLRKQGAIYTIDFSANIGATEEDAAQLGIKFNGAPIAGTTMISSTAAAGDLNSVGKQTAVLVPKTCCCALNTITVTNTGETTVNIGADPSLFIKRVA